MADWRHRTHLRSCWAVHERADRHDQVRLTSYQSFEVPPRLNHLARFQDPHSARHRAQGRDCLDPVHDRCRADVQRGGTLRVLQGCVKSPATSQTFQSDPGPPLTGITPRVARVAPGQAVYVFYSKSNWSVLTLRTPAKCLHGLRAHPCHHRAGGGGSGARRVIGTGRGNVDEHQTR